MSLKRVLALVLALTMIFSLAMPGSWAFAEDDGIIAVEDEYNDEGIVEESEEEAPAITEETPDEEEPAAEEIVAEQPAEEPEETAEELEEELEELTLEDLETFEAVNPDDPARNTVRSYSKIQDAFADSDIGNITITKNTEEDLTVDGSAPADIVVLGQGYTVRSLTVTGGNITLNNVIVSGDVSVSGGTLTVLNGEVKGTLTLSGGTANLNTTVNEQSTGISVKGGTLSITGGTYSFVEVSPTAGTFVGNVTGGTFDRISKALLADGAVTDNYFDNQNQAFCKGEVELREYAGMIYNDAKNRVYYNSFADLFDAAKRADGVTPIPTVYLLKNMTEDIAIPVGYQVKVSTVEAYDKTVKFKADSESNDLIATLRTETNNDTYTIYKCVASGTAVARNDKVSYLSLAEAVAAAKPGDTIELRANIDTAQKMTGTPQSWVTVTRNLTLDLAGHDITTAGGISNAGGNLTITGTGSITTTASGASPVDIYGSATGDLTIGSGVTLNGPCYGLNIFGTNDATKNTHKVDIYGTINGMVFVLGNLGNAQNDINITVYNGAVIDTKNCTVREENVLTGIALNGNANLTVKAGAKISGETGIEVRAGSLTVEGGKIIGTAEYSAVSNGNGPSVKGAGIAVSQHTTYLPITVNVSNGEISGDIAFATENIERSTTNTPSVQITNGNFTATGTKDAVKSNDARINVKGFVEGGTFNTPVDQDYCVATYNPVITRYENGTPVYGVTTQNYAYQLVKYPTNTDVYSGGADQGYTFAQQADAIRDAIASAAAGAPAERVLIVETATPTNVTFTAVGQKLIYAAADETEGRISFTYPGGCFGDEIVDAAHGVKSVTVTRYGAQVYEDEKVTGAYKLSELQAGFAYANDTEGAEIHVLQAAPSDFAYTMAADKDKTLSVTYAEGVAPVSIKAPDGWQLHKQGNTYRVGKGIFRIDNIEAAKKDYFDNLNDAAEESIKTGCRLNILGTPKDTYNLATGTTLHVVGGIDIKDKLVSGTYAIIKTTTTENGVDVDHYTTARSVARIGETYYNSFAAAAPVAFNSTDDKTVVLLGALPADDHFGPLQVPGSLSVTFDDGVNPYDLTGLITVDPAFMITPDSTTVPGVTTFTISEIVATIKLGDNTDKPFDNLNDAADYSFDNENYVVTPVKAGLTYTFEEENFDKTLRIATGTNIPTVTIADPGKPYFADSVPSDDKVDVTIGKYVASVSVTTYVKQTNADYSTSIVVVPSTENVPNPAVTWYKDDAYTQAVRGAEYTTANVLKDYTMELFATPSAESVVMYKDNIRVKLNGFDAKLVAPDGWTKTSTTDTESNVTTYHLTQDSYTVTFTGLGENVEDVVMTATYNQKVSDIAGKGTNPTVPDPAKTGYTRQGWVEVIDADATQAIPSISNFAITKNVTVKPNWVANSYTLTLNPNGADEYVAIVLPMTYGTSTDLPENTFERTGYDFAGWTTTADGDVVAYEDGATVSNLTAVNNGPVTLYAKWIPVQFTIALNINNGSNTAPVSVPVTYGTATDLHANTFTWDGHGFQGWSLTATGNAYASDASTLTAEDVAYLYSQASGDPLTVNFYAVWEEGVAQVGDTFYSFADAVRQANNQADKTIILWKDPENGDVYGFNATNLPSVINIKDMRSDVPATKTIDKLMLVNDDALYFAATDPVDGVVTYTLHRNAAKLTDGTGETTYYKNFETTNGVTGAVDEFLLHSNYYNFIDILDDVEYTMTKETWEGKRLPIKETGDAVFTPKTVDDSYTIVDVDANPKDEKFIYTIETNVVVVDYFLEKYQKSKVQGEFEWVADEDFTYEDLVYPHMGTMKFESLEKAIEAIRIARGAYTGKSYQPEYIFEEAAGSVYGKRVRVNITLNASGEMALRGNEEYTITLGNNDVLVDASLDDEAVEGYAVRTSGENPVTYKACPVHGIAYGVAVDGVADQITQAELALQPQSFTTFDESLTFADLERIGYTFQGWTWRYDDGHNNGTTPAKSLVISDLSELNGNLNVLAHFTATLVAVNFLDTDGEQLSYSNNGQTLTLEPMNVAYATTLETLEGTNGYHTPEKTGYTFEGWTIQNTTAVLANNYEFKTTPVTLVPNWEIVKPTVTFVNQSKKIAENAGEADVIYTYKAYYNTTVIDIGDPLHPIDEAMHASGSEGAYSYPGYRFDKWYSDAAMTKAFDFTTTVGTEPIKVYGRFLKDSYFLTLDYKGGTDADGNTAVDPIEFTMNTAPIKLPVLKIADTEYEFEGWVAKDDDGNVVGEYTKTKGFDLSNIVVDPTNAAFQKNMTWTAVFKGKDVKLVFIDGSKILYKVTAKAGDVVNEIANLKTLVDDNTTLAKKIGDYPDGKTLVESRLWKDTTADTVVKTTDTAFHLNWLDLHEVKFFAKDVEIQTQKIADGELIKDFPIARIDGAEAFWHIGSVDGELFTKDTPVTSDLKLYATFAEKVTVTFKADAKTVIKTVEVVSGEPVAKIDDPEKKGYTFVGWFLDGAEEAFNFETAITANTTLTAKFAATNELFKDVKFAATSTLSESINLNLYMWNLPAGTDIGDYTVKVKVADNPEVENKFDKSGDKYKTIAERAYAKQMNQKVQMTVYYKDLVIKEIKDYSLRQYFENRYAATTGNEQTMFKAALDYGAAAQTYFGFETDNLANSTVNPENTFVVPVKPQSNASREGVIDDIPNYGATLIMDSEITVRFKVNPSSVDGIDFEVSEGFKKSEVSGPDASGYYYVDVTGYSPSKLGNPVTLTITKGDELVEIQYSPYAYAASKWASTFRNGSEAKLVQAMYIFGEAVKAYFHN